MKDQGLVVLRGREWAKQSGIDGLATVPESGRSDKGK